MKTAVPFPPAPARRTLGFSLPFRISLIFVVISAILSVVGIGYASYTVNNAEEAFAGGLSIALGFIASGAVGLYLLVDHYLDKLHRIEQERRAALDELRRVEDSMLRADSLAAIAAGTAHDVNNFIQPLSLGLDVLAGCNLEPSAQLLVKRMQSNIADATSLVKELLAFGESINDAKAFQPCQLDTMLRSFELAAGPALPAGVKLEVQLPADLPLVEGNPEQLLRVLHNVTANARDALAERGGHIGLVAARRTENNRDWVAVTVNDDGPGIKPEILPHLFTPFYTTKSRGRGTGLGLAIVRRVMRGHGGDVTIASTPGAGTTVTLLLPVRD